VAGDASFSIKAKERINGVTSKAKILMLVSHDMSSITNLCNRVIVLNHGQIMIDDKSDVSIEEYRKLVSEGVCAK
jgi:lipopolysaccharide transport system ATP-binding protein